MKLLRLIVGFLPWFGRWLLNQPSLPRPGDTHVKTIPASPDRSQQDVYEDADGRRYYCYQGRWYKSPGGGIYPTPHRLYIFVFLMLLCIALFIWWKAAG